MIVAGNGPAPTGPPGVTQVSFEVASADVAGAVIASRSPLELDRELLGQRPLRHHAHGLCHPDQLRCDENPKLLMSQLAVGSEVLVLDVGVDRHLCDFASTGWADEIDRHGSALLLQQLLRVIRDLDLHIHSLPHKRRCVTPPDEDDSMNVSAELHRLLDRSLDDDLRVALSAARTLAADVEGWITDQQRRNDFIDWECSGVDIVAW